jgi:ATP-dependent Lon protease
MNIRKIIIPEKNKKDLAEIPSNIKRKLTFVPVSCMDEVLRFTLHPKSPKKKTGKSSSK